MPTVGIRQKPNTISTEGNYAAVLLQTGRVGRKRKWMMTWEWVSGAGMATTLPVDPEVGQWGWQVYNSPRSGRLRWNVYDFERR